MIDVARLASVSHQTVSRVLNDHASVSPQTRLRVRAAMTELGYRPNQAARALVTGESQVLGVLTQSSALYGPASLLNALEQSAGEAGFAVTVASVPTLNRASILEGVGRNLDQGVAGIVVIAPVVEASAALDAMTVDVPMICIDGDPAGTHPVVTVDRAEGARLATQFLLNAGHETVWHAAGPLDWFDSLGRLQGWRSTLEAADRDVPPPLQAVDWSPESGYRVGRILARIAEVTAVFAANDHLSLGILTALREARRSVPDEISVVGFDDIPESAYFVPPLTTVRPDFVSVAKQALALLIDEVHGIVGAPQQRVTIPPDLVIRKSVAGPPTMA